MDLRQVWWGTRPPGSTAAASCSHSKRFARFGGSLAALCCAADSRTRRNAIPRYSRLKICATLHGQHRIELIRMIGTAHHRSAGDVAESQLPRALAVLLEFFGPDEC